MKNPVKKTIVSITTIAVLILVLLVCTVMLASFFIATKVMRPVSATVIALLFVVFVSLVGHEVGLDVANIRQLITEEEQESEEEKEE